MLATLLAAGSAVAVWWGNLPLGVILGVLGWAIALRPRRGEQSVEIATPSSIPGQVRDVAIATRGSPAKQGGSKPPTETWQSGGDRR
jgi:hypothetical protein